MSRCSVPMVLTSMSSKYQNLEGYVGSASTFILLIYPPQVVELDHLYRERVHHYQLHAYMYGQVIPASLGISSATSGGESLADLVLAPSSTVINFGDLSIFRIGAGEMEHLSWRWTFVLIN